MIKAVLLWLSGSNTAKAAGATAAGGGVSMLVLLGALDHKLDNSLAEVKTEAERYVDVKHDNVLIQIEHIKENQVDIKKILRSIDSRVYQLKRESN